MVKYKRRKKGTSISAFGSPGRRSHDSTTSHYPVKCIRSSPKRIIKIDLGFLMRGEIIWNKAASASGSTAWGSWLSASNPTLRDVHEYILVFSKAVYKRKKADNNKNTIVRD